MSVKCHMSEPQTWMATLFIRYTPSRCLVSLLPFLFRISKTSLDFFDGFRVPGVLSNVVTDLDSRPAASA